MKPLLLATAITLNVLYLVMASIARTHMRDETRKDQIDNLLTVTLWWPFYNEFYKPSARRLRIAGIGVLAGCVVAYVLWAIS